MKKKKIFNCIVDVLLIAAVFSITDIVLQKVFQSENIWLELGIYILFYGIVFGAKWGVMNLWNRFVTKRKNGGKENEASV